MFRQDRRRRALFLHDFERLRTAAEPFPSFLWLDPAGQRLRRVLQNHPAPSQNRLCRWARLRMPGLIVQMHGETRRNLLDLQRPGPEHSTLSRYPQDREIWNQEATLTA